MQPPLLIGRRLQAARERRQLTQAQLSDQLGFNDRQTVTAIEAGQRKLSAEELIRAIQILGVDLEYFTDPFRLVGEGSFNWRAHEHTSPQVLDSFEEKAGGWIALYRKLEEKKRPRSPLSIRLALDTKASFEEAWSAAESLVERWNLGDTPGHRLAAAIHDHLETLVLYVDAPPSISGAACHLPDLNTILINRHEPAGRRNFDLAHECFHLLTWERMTPQRTEVIDAPARGKGTHKRIEQLADNFAGALLMPEVVVTRLWNHSDGKDIHDRLNETANLLGVTASALRYRLLALGVLCEADLLEINDNRLVANGQRGTGMPPPPFSKEFVGTLHHALENGDLSVRRAATIMGSTIEELAQLFAHYELDVPFDL